MSGLKAEISFILRCSGVEGRLHEGGGWIGTENVVPDDEGRDMSTSFGLVLLATASIYMNVSEITRAY